MKNQSMGYAHAPLAALLLLASCTTVPRTQVMVVITADAQVQEELSNLRIEVRGGANPDVLAEVETFERASIAAWPLRVPIVPRDNDVSRAFGVEVTAQTARGAVIARGVSGFIAQSTRMLHIHLSASCLDVPCGPDETCGDGECGAAYIAPAALPTYVEEFDAGVDPSDAGPIDGGPVDGGPIDGGPIDAGPIDAGALCGNGITEGDEECDDGRNGDNGDGCTDACRTGCESATDCGDGEPCNGEEACNDGACEAGSPRADGELCYDGVSGEVCVAGACVVLACGNGVVEPGEDCDEGGETADCNANCTTAACGDGIINATAAEQCDTGPAGGEGCASCSIDVGWTCTGEPSICMPICGDGLRLSSEECDDGNTDPADTCSATCEYSPGVIAIAISGVVRTASHGGRFPGVVAGSTFTGRYVYTPATVTDTNTSSDVGDYWFTSPGNGIELEMEGYQMRSDFAGPNFLIEVVNRASDNYLLRSYNNVSPAAGVFIEYISWQLDNASGSALSSDALPLTPPDLTVYTQAFGLNVEGSGFDWYIRCDVTTATLLTP